MENAIKEVTVNYDKINSEITKSEDDAKETQRKLFETLSKLGDVKAQISALNAEKTTYSEQLKSLESNLVNVQSKHQESKINVDNCKKEVEKLETTRNQLNVALNNHLQEQSKLDAEYKQTENNFNTINSNIISLQHCKLCVNY